MINLILSAPVKEMTEAFKRVFANADNVNIVGKPFEAIREFDCMVSAANSFGLTYRKLKNQSIPLSTPYAT